MLAKAVNIPPAGSVSHSLKNWQKLTLNQDILSVLKGYKTPFIKIPFQEKIPNFTKMNKKQIALVDLELKEMLKKGAIMRTQPAQGEFLSNLFLVRKKDGLALLFEIRGNKEQTYDQMEQRDLPLSSKSHYGYHSTIPAFSTEYSSRQRIKKKNRLSRVASLSQSFSSCFSTTRFSNNRYI